jgi:hypothetical protein
MIAIGALVVPPVPAVANDITGQPDGEDVSLHGDITFDGDDPSGIDEVGSDGSDTYVSYDDEGCGPNQTLEETFLQASIGGPWLLSDTGCGNTSTVAERPVLTPGMILTAVRTIGLPDSTVEVPPKTLVNYETTVYTTPADFARTVTLLGYTVDVRAHPSSFAWHFGDGETRTTSTPGAPYPSELVTHTWQDAHRTFHPRVDTTYTVSYRVDGGPWLDLGDTVSVTGPETTVRVKEASPRLH